MVPSQALQRARDLVAKGWCQGAEARASDGSPVAPDDARATSWSLAGALVAVVASAADGTSVEQAGTSALALAVARRPTELAAWNDDPRRRPEDVLRAYDDALALLPPPAGRSARNGGGGSLSSYGARSA